MSSEKKDDVSQSKYVVSIFSYVGGEPDDSEFDVSHHFDSFEEAASYVKATAKQYKKEKTEDLKDSKETENETYVVSKGQFLSKKECMVLHQDDMPKEGLPDSRYYTKYEYDAFIFRIHKTKPHKSKKTKKESDSDSGDSSSDDD